MARHIRLVLAKVTLSGVSAVITIPLGWGETYRLDISPANDCLKLGGESVLFVRMRQQSAFKLPEVQAMCLHFKITPAEGRVLLALVAGHTPGEIAAASGVAERTVRNQVASLLQKMDCSRQSELVRLVSLLQ